jgi:hypothetical protein
VFGAGEERASKELEQKGGGASDKNLRERKGFLQRVLPSPKIKTGLKQA